eukprot:TRINITY_DN9674_c0_g1_i1.p1 TRINITY_DN9674_c0_g1~~TRINITY_DN9674_c0_g1_i1.p1  ORF type:complete len:487 (+),score=101.48 TRINITY_DN9674_c0_g1_i1:39-1463(+)
MMNVDTRKGDGKGGKGQLGGHKGVPMSNKGGRKGDGKHGRKGDGKGGKKGPNDYGYKGPSSSHRSFPYPHNSGDHSHHSNNGMRSGRPRPAPQGLPVINTDRMVMPPLSAQLGQGVCLSYTLPERGLLQILQQHRHRTNIPTTIQKISFELTQTDSIPIPVNGTVEVKFQGEPQEESPMDVDQHTESVSVFFLCKNNDSLDNSVLTHDFAVLTNDGDNKIPKMVKGPIQNGDWKSSAISALNRYGIDCSDISEWIEFASFSYSDGTSTKVVIPQLWLPPVFHCTASTNCCVRTLGELLQGKEDDTHESFETLASADLLVEYIERVCGAKFFAYLRGLTEKRKHDDDYESDHYQPHLFSVTDKNFLSSSMGAKTGIVDVERLATISAASGDFLSHNELSRLLSNIQSNDNTAWYDNSRRPAEASPQKPPSSPAKATPSKEDDSSKVPDTPNSNAEEAPVADADVDVDDAEESNEN